ncbi:hypothetical protein [Catenulispora subtropica]|uniref:Uncharacterized protein n=1 Tax=Catenulispora subtropica TaxID=450798 RepID=A0ABN2RCK7_9ACTN
MSTGDFIVARRRTPLPELPLVGGVEPACGPNGEEGVPRATERRPGNWGCFAKVRLRADGDYELEYCDPSSAERCSTVTPSLDKVVAAMTEWSASEVAWREDFQGSQIGPA